jgi:hypothetical protein
VSIPTDPVRYDLVADIDGDLVRVQVKSAVTQGPGSATGRSQVGLTHMRYAADRNGTNSNGKRVRALYTPDEIDYFFVTIFDGRCYLVPIQAVLGQATITLGRRSGVYERYCVSGPAD